MSAPPDLTQTEQRFYDKLSDMMAHPVSELIALLPHDLGENNNVHYHISNLRRKVRRKAQDVFSSRNNGTTYYVLSRLVYSSDE
jgi:hypothetical protein